MPERNTAKRAAAENTKPSTRYTYNHNYLPPLAILGALPEAEGFSARPDWISLAGAFRRAEAAHGEHEKRTGERDANWPDWYAAYMVAEQSGTELPT